MARTVEIERHSGFCGGVIRAIGTAEAYLDAHPGGRLHSLGAIVHNEAELERLAAKGLVTIRHEDIPALSAAGAGTVLIRAHGEPPASYKMLSDAGLEVVDCTCPVVLKLQEDIRAAHARLAKDDGGLVIFGKVGHAEVLGLLGQVGGDALVLERPDQLEAALREGRLRTDRPVEVFSQTTKSPVEYAELCRRIQGVVNAPVTVHRTICSQVASRHEQLAVFAAAHDAILFVSGSTSSNGKVLYDLCRSVNPRARHISSETEIRPGWFGPGERVGICGATSTPRWLLEKVADAVRALPE